MRRQRVQSRGIVYADLAAMPHCLIDTWFRHTPGDCARRALDYVVPTGAEVTRLREGLGDAWRRVRRARPV